MENLKAIGSFIVLKEIKEEKKEGVIEYNSYTPYMKAEVLSVGNEVKEITISDIVYLATDCVKLKFEDSIFAVDSKYIVAKE